MPGQYLFPLAQSVLADDQLPECNRGSGIILLDHPRQLSCHVFTLEGIAELYGVTDIGAQADGLTIGLPYLESVGPHG